MTTGRLEELEDGPRSGPRDSLRHESCCAGWSSWWTWAGAIQRYALYNRIFQGKRHCFPGFVMVLFGVLFHSSFFNLAGKNFCACFNFLGFSLAVLVMCTTEFEPLVIQSGEQFHLRMAIASIVPGTSGRPDPFAGSLALIFF
jgi:hypothetical protein